MSVQLDSPAQKVGQFIFWIPMVVCSMEMVPGWGFMNLGWPPAAFYGIMAACGAVGGMLIGHKYLVPGLVGGGLAGVGGLYAAALLLQNTDSTHTAIVVLVTLIGCLPGVGVGYLLKMIQDRMTQPALDEPTAV